MISIRLPLPPNFSFDAVVRSHGWYNLPPFEYDREKGELKTSVEVPPLSPAGVREGSPLASLQRRPRPKAALSRSERPAGRGEGRARVHNIASITFRVRKGRLEASSEVLSREELRRIARRVFSLDLQLDTFAASLATEPLLARALARGNGRMLRAPTVFEDAVKILFTTNCSWAATRGMVARLIGEAGAQGQAFPTAQNVARLSVSALEKKVRCGYRAEALARLARRVASNRLDLSAWESADRPAEEIRAEILAERGFGPYAAEGLLRILGRYDFLALDSWTRQKYRRLHPGPAKTTDRSIARRYARFGDWRGLALWIDMTRDWHETDEPVWP